MALSYTKLVEFDLLYDLEAQVTADSFGLYLQFLNIFQDIQNANQFILELPAYPQSTKSIIRDELVSAIGSTLAIEGISVREEEIKETIQESSLQEGLIRKQQEVLNSQKVYDYILTQIDNSDGKFDFTNETICNTHKLFTEFIDYPGNSPGQYRSTGTTFGEPRKPSLCASNKDVIYAMGNFVYWLNKNDKGMWSGNIIAKAIMTHYYLTEIHPFGDGNGRTARAVEAMVLLDNNINTYCFWSLANFWSAHRNEYIGHLDNIRNTCNPYEFLMWGAQGYLEQVLRIKGLVLRKVELLMFRDYVTWLLATNKTRPSEKRVSKRIVAVLEYLTVTGKVLLHKFRFSPPYKALYSNLSESSQTRDLKKMESLGLIRITPKDEKELFIEPNYEIFKNLEYSI